jgi:hypothetical protein
VTVMKKITESRKYQNGIQIFFDEKNEDEFAFISFPELIDMKINALDLLEHPSINMFDDKQQRIISTA